MSHTGVLAKLHQHHESIHRLIHRINERIDQGRNDYGRLYDELRRELLSHSTAEDEVLYSALAAHDQCREDVRDGREEHDEIAEILHELDRTDDEDEWVSTFQELEDAVSHHIHEVETETFPMAARVLELEELKKLAQEYQRERARAQSSARGEEPDEEEDLPEEELEREDREAVADY